MLYVGDNERPSPAVAAAVEAKLPLEIFGRFWAGNIDDSYIKGEYIHDNDLGAYFSSAKINLVNVSEHESQIGMIPSRVYDICRKQRLYDCAVQQGNRSRFRRFDPNVQKTRMN